MTQMRRFPSIETVIQIHADLISQFGGVPGIRDAEALESALLRPWVGNYDGIAAEAAALMEGLFHYRPFYDGNKRTSTAIGEIFLQENGYFIVVDDIFDAFYFFVQLFDDGMFLFHNLYPWLSEHIRPRP